MNKVIPIFPLELVVYPGEALNLHIFEPRYKQLITDSFKARTPFGIPSVVDKQIMGMGTLVELLEITNVAEDGQMDIKTRGFEIFRINETFKQLPSKLYSGARIEFLKNEIKNEPELLRQVYAKVKVLLKLVDADKEFPKPIAQMSSYDLAHHAGLSPLQEYELLGLLAENLRLEYLDRHLVKILPIVGEIKNLKAKIQLNGYFKALPGFEL